MLDLTTLNNVQKQIVEETQGPIMVLAGAGSGKTRVLTHRIAYILEQNLCEPWNILAITFTNKAANEMKERLSKMGENYKNVWAMTFHSLCTRLLRFEAQHLEGYTADFSIYDETDKKNVLKRLCSSFEIDKKIVDEVAKHISNRKNKNMTIDDYLSFTKSHADKIELSKLMHGYEDQLKNNNAFDFDDLLSKTHELLLTNAQVREKYQNQFKYILVDEFQDTNAVQYDFVKILGALHKNVFAVGDEDQSIYSWRGANIGNIQAFLKDFVGARLFKLEQNYRSTKSIIESANKIIKCNVNRIDKTLWTANSLGQKVMYKRLYNERREADSVVQEIYKLVQSMGYKYSDCAVLMRMNALSRPLEDAFLEYNMPYKVFGGLKFYDRLEIKAILAYLKVLVNPNDDESFTRIVNYPKRGIGDSALALLKLEDSSSYINALNKLDNSSRLYSKFLAFKEIYDDLMTKLNSLGLIEGQEKQADALVDFVEYVIDRSELKATFIAGTDEDLNRLENLKSLVNSVEQFEKLNPNATLSEYLQSVSLVADIDSYTNEDDYIVLSTIHAVKGLEFKVVFIVGLEEGYMPIIRQDEVENIEEERRLMYVAITRAMERLYLSNCESRYMYNSAHNNLPSRFLFELDLEEEKRQEIRAINPFAYVFKNKQNSGYTRREYSQYSNEHKPSSSTSFGGGSSLSLNALGASMQSSKKFSVGDKVTHPQFGLGIVKEINKGTDSILILFESVGNKILSLKFAPIKLA